MNGEVSQTVSLDMELQRRIRDGDNTAFATLYTRYKQDVYMYCTRFLGRSGDADDIFQDVFIGFLERVRKGMEIESIPHYLMRSARNRCLNAIRNRKHHRSLDEYHCHPCHRQDEANEIQEIVQNALQRLSDNIRETFVLREYAGYSYEEIASLTDVSIGTVSKRMYSARKQLRAILLNQ